MPFFFIYFFFSQICIETSIFNNWYFTYSNFASGLHGDVDVMWSGSLFWSCIDVIVGRVKVSRGILPFSPLGIDSADTNHPSNGEICMGKSHLLPKNPARQCRPLTIEAAEC